MSLIDEFVTDLAATYADDDTELELYLMSQAELKQEKALARHPDCRDPDHPGCRNCDEDALSLSEREDYEERD